MQTPTELKAFIYDMLLERERVMREANQLVDTISQTANIEVDKINKEIQDAREILDKLAGEENQEEE
jgi:archaellum component FlaC